jgi:hypothetical protein
LFTIPVLRYMRLMALTDESAMLSVELKIPARPARRTTKFGYYGVPGLGTMRGGKGVTRAAEFLWSATMAAGFEPSVLGHGELSWRAVSLDIPRGMRHRGRRRG